MRALAILAANIVAILVLLAMCTTLGSTTTEACSTTPEPSEPAEPCGVSMKVTAYCPCSICCGKWATYGRTKTDDDAKVCDGVAADPQLIPYRTKLWIPGAGLREVDDTGGAMRQSAKEGIYHIDLRFPTHAEARAWGVQYLYVTLLDS